MDKFIKENKIVATIIIVLIIVFGVGYFYKQTPKTESDLSLQTKCSEMATKTFISNGYKSSDGADYKNHFNSKLNKCFILISSYDINSDFQTIDLYDVIERKHYASYMGHSDCGVPLLGGDNSKKCQLDSGSIWYDGNDTKNPADYHVGFQGVAIGPGVGDENTQKQFLDHIQPFMSE